MLKSSLLTKEKLIINGVVEPTHTSGKLIGEVQIIEKDKFGRTVFSTTDYNDITIAGSQFILEQLGKLPGNDNQRFYFPSLSSNDNNLIGQEKIIGFMVGCNGENSVGIHPVKYAEYVLSGGSGDVSSLMYFKNNDDINKIDTLMGDKSQVSDSNGNKLSTGEDYLCPLNDKYYVKKPEQDLTIHHIWSDGSGSYTTDVNENDTTNYNIPISSYIEAKLYIDSMDCRKFFVNRDGGVSNCTVNQIGLITGVINNDKTITNMRLLTSLNFKGRELSNYENTLTFIYRIYCL